MWHARVRTLARRGQGWRLGSLRRFGLPTRRARRSVRPGRWQRRWSVCGPLRRCLFGRGQRRWPTGRDTRPANGALVLHFRKLDRERALLERLENADHLCPDVNRRFAVWAEHADIDPLAELEPARALGRAEVDQGAAAAQIQDVHHMIHAALPDAHLGEEVDAWIDPAVVVVGHDRSIARNVCARRAHRGRHAPPAETRNRPPPRLACAPQCRYVDGHDNAEDRRRRRGCDR